MRDAYYVAADNGNVEHVKLGSSEVDQRLRNGPELVSAKFVIPYPPGFPFMVPGQVVTKEVIAFMRALDVKEVHGYVAEQGLELFKPEALAKHRSKNRKALGERTIGSAEWMPPVAAAAAAAASAAAPNRMRRASSSVRAKVTKARPRAKPSRSPKARNGR